MRLLRELSRVVVTVALGFFAACAPAVTRPARTAAAGGLPPVPPVEGPLAIRVIHPIPAAPRPNVDSTYIYGSVGTGRAELTINGVPVEVRPNGAFLAYLPVPATGVYELAARAGGRDATATVPLRVPQPPGQAVAPSSVAAPATTEFSPERLGIVTGGADTLATGSDVAVGRPTPSGTYRWFLPRGARLRVTGERGDQYRVQLDTAAAWFPRSAVTLEAAPAVSGAAPRARPMGAVTTTPNPEGVDLRLDADSAAFSVQAESGRLLLTIHGRAPGSEVLRPHDPLITGAGWLPIRDAARLEILLSGPLWGYKAFYADNGDLVLRIRRPPQIERAAPLRGLRIVVDPGHPPAGATGPTGLTEAQANLGIGLRLAEQLRARGAQVVLTRTQNVDVSIAARVNLAVATNAHLLVSVHNNAFAEGVNPFVNNGTSAYYFHPFSAELARALDREIAGSTRIRDLGAKWGNLALVRPTWMPSALTESLFMLIPEQEAALRDPAFLDRLAAAHVRGIEEFLRSSVIGHRSSVSGRLKTDD